MKTNFPYNTKNRNIMTRIEGRAPSPQMMYSNGLLAEVKAQTRNNMLLDAAGFHGRLRAAAIGPSDVPHLVQRGQGSSAIERELGWWLKEAQLIMQQADPRLEYLTRLHRWMIEHQPLVRPATLVHGDAQIANLMFRDGRLVAALDWELSYLGHSEADLALLVYLLKAHMPDDPVAGVPSEAEVVSRYEAECGARVEHWAFFQLLNLVKVSTIMCMTSHDMDAELADAMWQLNAEDREIAWERARAAV
jgi:aminoglycoside phosphotransferase (APT) family kinase protein